MNSTNYQQLITSIRQWAKELGFNQAGITNVDLSDYEAHFNNWLLQGHQADMAFIEKNKEKYQHPERLLPGTKSIICVSMNYFRLSNDCSVISNL